MKIHRHNVAMRWITRRRTNEVAGLYESFPGTFSAYQEALSSGFQGTMEEFIQQQSIPQGDRPFTGKVGGLVEPGVTHYATQTSAEKRATHYKKLLENLPEGYYNEYVENFYTVDKDTGKLRHVSGGPEGKGIPYMEKKYGDIIKKTYKTRQGETINLNRKVRNINAAIKQSISDKIESGLKPSRQVRKADLKIVGNWQPTAPKGYVTHHFMPLAGVEGESLNLASTKNTAFISKELNSKMAPYNTKLKANQKEQIKLLKEKPKGWEKRIEELNFKAKNIYKEAAKKVPGSSGYLGYSQYIKQPDGSYVPKVIGINPNKSLAGLDGEEIFYKNITKENQLKVNKMSNIKSNKIIKASGTALHSFPANILEMAEMADPRKLPGDVAHIAKGVATKFPKTMGLLKGIFETKSIPGMMGWGIEPILLMAGGLHGRYASERDFKAGLIRAGASEQEAGELAELYGQDLADLGNVGLESWAVDQPNTYQLREDIKKDYERQYQEAKSPHLDRDFMKQASGIRDAERRMQDYEKQLEEIRRQEIWKKAKGRGSKTNQLNYDNYLPDIDDDK